MNLKQAIEILKKFNEWRRWWELQLEDPKILWEAIDVICNNNNNGKSN